MSGALGLTLLRIGFLAMLWIFVLIIVLVTRRDIYGTRIGERRKAQPAKSPRPAQTPSPSPRQAPTPMHQGGGHTPTLVVTGGALIRISLCLRYLSLKLE